MTADLTVPADVWACQRPGVPFVAAIMEGELETGFYFGPDRFNPPAWLVALRDARCECVCHAPTNPLGPGSCCACHDGRLLHDVRVECGCPCHTSPDPDIRADAYLCDECDELDNGHRTVRCLVGVVPVVSDVDDLPSEHACVEVDDGGVRYWPSGADLPEEATPLAPAHVDALAAACGKPPADWVGGYAVILTTTNQEAE